MLRNLTVLCLFAWTCVVVADDDAAPEPIMIGLIGDSTVATTYGWGPAFEKRVTDRVTVLHYAKNGATLDSLSGRLDELLERKPDYVLIQFGHNDMKRYGAEAYAEKLADYVERVKRAGGKTIVLSSVTRRNFDEDGRIEPRVVEGRTLPQFARAAERVAKDAGVPFIDLNAISIAHHNALGPEASAAYNFNADDATHFSPAGAAATVELILPALRTAAPELAAYIAEPTAAPAEMRGVWLQPYAITDEARAATLEKVERLGINTVFLRTPTVGENRGWGNDADFEATLDALARRGVAVHAWITNKMRTGDPQAAAAQADFTDPAERAAQAAWAVVLIDRWPRLAGVHLDYIRYTDWAAPEAAKMDAVTATVRDIRGALRERHPRAQLTAAVFTGDPSYVGGRWGDDKQATFDGDVPGWYREWWAAHPDSAFHTRPAALHAAGKFDGYNPRHVYGPTFLHVQQDPVSWLREGLVDSIQVMQYTADRERWATEARTWAAWFEDEPELRRRVTLGLGWLTEDGQPDWRRDAAALADHVRAGREAGLGGWSVFTIGVKGTDDGPLMEALGAGE